MSYVIEATYEDGVLKLDGPLPLKDREKVRVTVEGLDAGRQSILDIPPVSLGQMLCPLTSDDDLLGEMLEGRHADEFDREVAALGSSEKFLSFLETRSKKGGDVPISEVLKKRGMQGDERP
jgi:predicted DNA-binding antitoxin AbrB/MazE fold protein